MSHKILLSVKRTFLALFCLDFDENSQFLSHPSTKIRTKSTSFDDVMMTPWWRHELVNRLISMTSWWRYFISISIELKNFNQKWFIFFLRAYSSDEKITNLFEFAIFRALLRPHSPHKTILNDHWWRHGESFSLEIAFFIPRLVSPNYYL